MDAHPASIRTSIPPTAEAFRQWVAEPQHRRFMRLRFPHGDGPDAPLLVQRLDAEESLSRDFSFVVELLTDDAHLPLKSMMGKLLVIELVREDGHLRYFSGYVFAFSRQRADGAVVVYEAQLGPWFRLLSWRRDHHLFHDKTLHQQTADIFADYPLHARWQWQVSSGDATMTDAFQYGESDHNYLSRRWEAAGWHYWYEHDASGHTLIVGSDSCQQAAIDGEHSVRFHANGGSAEDDAIDRWSPQREMAASSVVLGSFDFKSPTPRWMEVPTLNRQGVAPAIEHYLYTGHHGYRDRDDGDAQSRLRIEEIEARARQVEGQGNCRAMMPGRWFRLVGHVEYPRFGGPSSRGRDEFLILSVRHRIHNNYFPLAAQDAVPPYRNEFRCMRRQIPWRPGPGYNSQVPIARGAQTATVVGVPGQPALWTDEYARVRVQFHWDREGHHDTGSSAWIRVASPWAGAQLGALALPRVGAEVLVQWLDGNPDRPVIVGSLYNADHLPPWALPAQRALTGLRSRELTDDGGNRALGRSNHLILDDTAGRLIQQESRFKHVINKDLEPIVAGDRGFGVVQLTNPMPSYSQIWSWKENVDAGIALLRKKRAAAKRDFEKEKPVSYTDEMLDTETITRWNGGKYHEWDQDKKKWVRQKSILCDTKTGNIGWDMTLESNSGKTESELHDRDKLTYSKMKAGQDEEHAWKYSGVCYADHIAAK